MKGAQYVPYDKSIPALRVFIRLTPNLVTFPNNLFDITFDCSVTYPFPCNNQIKYMVLNILHNFRFFFIKLAYNAIKEIKQKFMTAINKTWIK